MEFVNSDDAIQQHVDRKIEKNTDERHVDNTKTVKRQSEDANQQHVDRKFDGEISKI